MIQMRFGRPKKIYVRDLYDSNKSEKENIAYINDYVKNRIIELKALLDERLNSNTLQ